MKTNTNKAIETVWTVQVAERMDGLYLFHSLADAELFAYAVENAGGSATVTDQPVNGAHSTMELIAAEAQD